MDFSPKQRLTISKAIIELTDPSGGSGLAEFSSRGSNRFEDTVRVLYENDRRDLPSHHNRPLYVTSIGDVS